MRYRRRRRYGRRRYGRRRYGRRRRFGGRYARRIGRRL